jgi:small subunit ribosomal protein S10
MIIENKIKIKSFNKNKLIEIINKYKNILEQEDLTIKFLPLKKKRKKITVNKSTHVHKKSRDQYESISYTLILSIIGRTERIRQFINNIFMKENIDITYHIYFNKKFKG